MITRIPLQPITNQEFVIMLEQRDWNIRLIQRLNRMYLSLWIDNIEIWSGSICRDRLPFVQSKTQNVTGNLVFVDMEGTSDPTYEGLGSRYKLFYFTDDEILPDWFQKTIIMLEERVYDHTTAH